MSSLAFLAVASTALVVLMFYGGNAADVALHDVSRISKQQLEAANHSLSPLAADSRISEQKLALMKTAQRINGKVTCAATSIRGDYEIIPKVGAYKIHNRKLNWNDARKVCLAEGAQLAQLDTERKSNLFKVWKLEKGLTGLWLGFHDQFEKGSWVTVTGESMDTLNYHPWMNGEPNNSGGSEDCGILWAAGVNDLNCDTKETFICEITLCETE